MPEMVIFAFVPRLVLVINLLVRLVLVINLLVIRDIKQLIRRASLRMYKDSQRQSSFNQTSTVTLLSVSFYLICTPLPATIVYTLQSRIPNGDHKLKPYCTIRNAMEEMCFSNNACYVFIYYITGAYFRKEIHKMFCFGRYNSTSNKDYSTNKSYTSRTSRTSITNQYTLVTTNRIQDGEFSSTAC